MDWAPRSRKTFRTPDSSPPSALDPIRAEPPAGLEDPFGTGTVVGVKKQRTERSAVLSPSPVSGPSVFASKLYSVLSTYPHQQASEAIRHTLHILTSAWESGQQLMDCMENVASLPPLVTQLLTGFAGYKLSNCGRFLAPTGEVSSVVAIGSTIAGLHELLAQSLNLVAPEVWRPVAMSMVDVQGFLWPVDKNTVPSYCQRFSELGDLCIMSDAMLTDAAIPTICRQTGATPFTGHLLYGRGLAILASKGRFPSARKSGELRLDRNLIAVAVMLSPIGPQVIGIHVTDPSMSGGSTPFGPSTALPSAGLGFATTSLSGGGNASFSPLARRNSAENNNGLNGPPSPAFGRPQENVSLVERLVEWLTGLWFASIPSIITFSGSSRHLFTPFLCSVGWVMKDDVGAMAQYSGSSINRGPSCWGTAFDVLLSPCTAPAGLAFEDVPQSPRSLCQRAALINLVPAE
jgi:hypothetical protein